MSKRTLNTIAEFRDYLQQMFVTGRPGDSHPRVQHAAHVNQIVHSLAIRVIQYADPGSIEVGQTDSAAGRRDNNMVWFTVGGRSYALIYNKRDIDLRDRNKSGNVIATFNNAATNDNLDRVFAAL